MSEREAPNHMERGTRKYKEWVHNDTKKLKDSGKNPYTFSKPKHERPRDTLVECPHCGYLTNVTSSTVAVICAQCNKFYNVEKSVPAKREEITIVINSDRKDD